MSGARPWGKWYWGDWRKDLPLRMCSYAARGLWADLLSIMGEAAHFGFLLINGKMPTPGQLASLLGGTEREVKRLTAELCAAGVYSIVGTAEIPMDILQLIPEGMQTGTIFSRRMLRDKARAERDKQNGKGGGNPQLSALDNHTVNPPDKPGVNPPVKAHMLEARGQSPETESLSSALRPLPRKRSARSALNGHADQFEEAYSAFPRHVARGAGERAFVGALLETDFATLLAGVKAYAQSVVGKEPQYIAHFATWLRAKRWLDAPAGGDVLPERRRPQAPPRPEDCAPVGDV